MKCEDVIKLLDTGNELKSNAELIGHINTCEFCRREALLYYPEFVGLLDDGDSETIELVGAIKHHGQLLSANIEMPDEKQWRDSQDKLFRAIEVRQFRILKPAFAAIIGIAAIIAFIVFNPSNDLIENGVRGLDITPELATEYLISRDDGYGANIVYELFDVVGGESILNLIGIKDMGDAAAGFAEVIGEENIIASFDEKTQQDFLAFMQKEINYPGH